MERLEVIDLEKSFGRTRALAGVSFSVKQGELLALLGPSGCGKTTCLRLIAGFERPDKGDIRIDGASILGLPPERRGIGFVFQHYALFPHMTVAKNIAYGIRFRSGIDVRARVGELLSLVHLEGRADRRPAELSGGERQRVALARALAPPAFSFSTSRSRPLTLPCRRSSGGNFAASSAHFRSPRSTSPTIRPRPLPSRTESG